ncbi:MAG: arginine--tRNA ligase [bacterium]|nr:arginine--tRNA ligase [bacterium]
MMQIIENIKQELARALSGAGIEVAAQELKLLHPKELSHGDYASGLALQYAKQAGVSPFALAGKITASLGKIPGVARMEAVKPGFINFYLAPESVNGVLVQAIGGSEDWGKNDSQKNKRVMVEYTDPNPFKEFHIGHLMSNAIGESIARLVEYEGAEVKRANYQGDVGPHVAKAIWGIQKLGVNPHDAGALGKAYALGSVEYATSEHMGLENDGKSKKEMDEINTKIYDRSDSAINEIYDAGREASLAHFEEIYKMLGTKFDHYFFESETAPFGKKVVEEHPEIFEKSDGAIVYKGDEQKGLHTRVFINSRGLPTYETKELGLAKKKHDAYSYDKSIVITGNEVNDYFRVLLDAMAKVYPDLAAKTVHISHGMMRLVSGKMSSRTGDVITGESLITDLTEAAKARAAESRADNPEVLAQQVAVAAIKYQVLRQASGRDIIFDRERALSMEGDSGPYLQYAHARASQVVERAKSQGVALKIQGDAEPNDLSRLITRFPEAVEVAAKELEPHLLVNFLIELAGAFNSWYAQVHILDGTNEAPHKVAVTDTVRATLKNGLWLLGIPAPEKM